MFKSGPKAHRWLLAGHITAKTPKTFAYSFYTKIGVDLMLQMNPENER